MNSNYSKSSILEIFDNEPRISHRIIAEQTENQQKNVVELITKYKDKLELFGMIPFRTEAIKNAKNRINEQKTLYLNEQQATLLLTFMRNNEIIINFKVRLVKEFFEMRKLLLNPETPQQTKPPQTFENFDLDSQISQNKKLLEFIELITSQNPKNLFFLDKIYKSFEIKSPLELLQIDLNSYFFIPTEIGKFLNKSAVEINKMLEFKGFQFKENGEWFLTEKGQNFGFEFQNGSFKTIKWKLESLI